eukprot:1178504-Prorocentrum_minimum.AAC.2
MCGSGVWAGLDSATQPIENPNKSQYEPKANPAGRRAVRAGRARARGGALRSLPLYRPRVGRTPRFPPPPFPGNGLRGGGDRPRGGLRHHRLSRLSHPGNVNDDALTSASMTILRGG